MHNRYNSRAGDIFMRVQEQYGNKIFQNAHILCRDGALAKDIRQEVYIKLWLMEEKLETIADMESFLFTLTRNIFTDMKRKAQREQINKQDLLQHYRQFYPPPEDERHDTKLFEKLLRDAFQQLAPQQRKIFELLRGDNKSRKEVAALLNISEHTVKTAMQNAKRNLCRYLEQRLGHGAFVKGHIKKQGATEATPCKN